MVFVEGRKLENPEKKLSRARRESNIVLSHYTSAVNCHVCWPRKGFDMSVILVLNTFNTRQRLQNVFNFSQFVNFIFCRSSVPSTHSWPDLWLCFHWNQVSVYSWIHILESLALAQSPRLEFTTRRGVRLVFFVLHKRLWNTRIFPFTKNHIFIARSEDTIFISYTWGYWCCHSY